MNMTNDLLAAYAKGIVSNEECDLVREYLVDNPHDIDTVMTLMEADCCLELGIDLDNPRENEDIVMFPSDFSFDNMRYAAEVIPIPDDRILNRDNNKVDRHRQSYNDGLEALLGELVENGENIEKKQDENSRFLNEVESLKKRTIKYDSMNVLSLRKHEIQTVENLHKEYLRMEDSSKSLKDNLVSFYLSQHPGMLIDNARTVVEGLVKGVTTFNETLNDALRQDIETGKVNYLERFLREGEDMSLDEKYGICANFLILLHVLEKTNLDDSEMNFKESLESLEKQNFVPKEGVTENELEELLDQIDSMLQNSTFCLTSLRAAKQLFDGINNAEYSIALVQNQEEDMKLKLITAMMTWIAVEKGEIESLSEAMVTPESIAVGVSAGIEEQKVLYDYAQGDTDEINAIRMLKIIGGVALAVSFVLMTSFAIAYVVPTVLEASLAFFGEGLLATIVSTLITLSSVVGVVALAMKIGTAVFERAEETFDAIVDCFQNTILPVTKHLARRAWKWIKSWFCEQDDEREYTTDQERVYCR